MLNFRKVVSIFKAFILSKKNGFSSPVLLPLNRTDNRNKVGEMALYIHDMFQHILTTLVGISFCVLLNKNAVQLLQ